MSNHYFSRRRTVSRRRARVRSRTYRAKASANRARVTAHNAGVMAAFEGKGFYGRKYGYRCSSGEEPTLCRAVIELKKVTEENIPWSDDQQPRDLSLFPSMLIEMNKTNITYKSLFIKSGEELSGKRRIFSINYGGVFKSYKEEENKFGNIFKINDKKEIEVEFSDLKKDYRTFCYIIPCKSSFTLSTMNEFDRKKLPKDLHEHKKISSYDPKSTPTKTSSSSSSKGEGEEKKKKEEEVKTKRKNTIVFCILFRESFNKKRTWRVMGIPYKLGGADNEEFENLFVTEDQPPYYEKTKQRILDVMDDNDKLQKRFLQSFDRIVKETKEITEKYEVEYLNFFKDLETRKKGNIHMECSAEKLDKMDRFFGKSDPYFRIRVDGDGDENEQNWYYKSEVIKRDLEPRWEPATCKKVRKLHKRHRLEVWDWNKIEKDQLIGYFTFFPQKVYKKCRKIGWGGIRKKARFYISRMEDISISKNKYLQSGEFFFEKFIIFGGKGVKKEDVIRKYDEIDTLEIPYEEAKWVAERIQFKKINLTTDEKKKKNKEEEEVEGEEEEEKQQQQKQLKDCDNVPEEEEEEEPKESSSDESDFDST